MTGCVLSTVLCSVINANVSFYVKTRKMSRTEGLTDFNALHKHLCLLWDYREKIKYKLNNLFLCLLNVHNGYYIT